jgi:hypothetical protein
MFDMGAPWPPSLESGETVLFQGGFDRKAWGREAVFWWAALAGIFWLLAPVVEESRPSLPIFYFFIGGVLAGAIVLLWHGRQQWIMTDRAFYITRQKPMPLETIRGFGGWGASIRVVPRRGASKRLLGIADAAQMRASLNGALA